MKNTGGYRLMIRHRLIVHVRRTRERVESDTQKIRSKLLADLQTMFDLAKEYVGKSKHPKQKQLFIRVMGYIAQVMNSLSKAFDEAAVTEDLEVLEKMINEAMAKGKDKATEATDPGTSGS